MCVNPNKSPDKIVRNWKLIPGEKKKKKKNQTQTPMTFTKLQSFKQDIHPMNSQPDERIQMKCIAQDTFHLFHA